jgi:multiple sugar transport system substrate-binding protein
MRPGSPVMLPSCRRAVLAVCAATWLSACPDPDNVPDAGLEITVFTWEADHISGAVETHLADFEAQTGIKVNLVAEPSFNDVFPTLEAKATAASTDFDAFLVANIWVADLSNLGYIEPLDDFITADINDAELAWTDIPDGMKKKNSYGGHTYMMTVDNDMMNLFYRKDIFGSTTWQTAYNTDTGRTLRVPETIDEMIEIADYFKDKDWNPAVTGEKSFVGTTERNTQAYWYGYSWIAPYTIMPTASTDAQGIFLFKPDDMVPLVNTPGFVRGIEKWKEMITLTGGGGTRDNELTMFKSGKALMAIEWGDIGPQSHQADSQVRDKVGVALTPGTREYYNYKTSAWETLSASAPVHRAPVHQFNGWAWYMASTSAKKEAAWRFIKFISGKTVSGVDVADPRGGLQPWRTSHNETTHWVANGWSAEFASNFVSTIIAATDHPNAALDIRLPGAADYGDKLEEDIVDAFADPSAGAVQTQMNQTAAQYEVITNGLGRSTQIQAYREHLGLQ